MSEAVRAARRRLGDEPDLVRTLDYLGGLGFEAVYLAPSATPASAPARPATSEPSTAPARVAAAAVDRSTAAARSEKLAALGTTASGCEQCALAQGRNRVVFGSGHPDADLMLVGEGPGYHEDRQGLPFVGAAGELLTKIIEAIGATREQVYIANVVKCRPPDNRDPTPAEVDACRGYLEAQIDLVKPRVLVLLGKVAARHLLGLEGPLGGMRGTWHRVRGVETRVTYHPAALLRSNALKRPTWEDMKLVRDRLARPDGADGH